MTLSFDIGGTKIAAGLVTEKYEVLNFKKTETPKNKDEFLSCLLELLKSYKQEYAINKIGIGCAGLIDKSGKMIKSPHLDFSSGFNLKEFMEKSSEDTETRVANDVHCFTLGEAAIGAGKDYGIVAGITIGTGLGGGICIDKRYFEGGQGIAGEFGHTTIDFNYKEKCACGNRGCLEQFVSGKAMKKYYQEITDENKSAKEIEELSYQGDKSALEAIEKMADFLGIGLANIVHSINPDAIIIGGSIGKTKTLFEPAIKSMRSRLISPEIKVEILPSELKDNAVLIGAALL